VKPVLSSCKSHMLFVFPAAAELFKGSVLMETLSLEVEAGTGMMGRGRVKGSP